jgi:GMP synthase (glutamine-hydrolysing)
MKKRLDQLRVLLIQIRETDDIARHEFDCVVSRGGFDPGLVQAVNIVGEPVPDWARAEAADVVLIGGAGVFSVTETHDFTEPLSELVCRLAEAGRPLLGLCWGHQFIAQALGGQAVNDPDKGEAGTHPVALTAAGRNDPLFAALPAVFDAHMGHNDYVQALPPGAIELARTQRCPNQAFRLVDKPIYGTQFHVELSAQQLIERLTIYRAIYTDDEAHFEDIKSNPMPTPESDGILPRFLELYVL